MTTYLFAIPRPSYGRLAATYSRVHVMSEGPRQLIRQIKRARKTMAKWPKSLRKGLESEIIILELRKS